MTPAHTLANLTIYVDKHGGETKVDNMPKIFKDLFTLIFLKGYEWLGTDKNAPIFEK